jgi:hypothetical protein
VEPDAEIIEWSGVDRGEDSGGREDNRGSSGNAK